MDFNPSPWALIPPWPDIGELNVPFSRILGCFCETGRAAPALGRRDAEGCEVQCGQQGRRACRRRSREGKVVLQRVKVRRGRRAVGRPGRDGHGDPGGRCREAGWAGGAHVGAAGVGEKPWREREFGRWSSSEGSESGGSEAGDVRGTRSSASSGYCWLPSECFWPLSSSFSSGPLPGYK